MRLHVTPRQTFRLILLLAAALAGVGYFIVLTPYSTPYDAFQVDRDLIVFVGKRMFVRGQGSSGGIMSDYRFAATYRVLQLLHGQYSHRYITFTVYDHYGTPGFSDYDIALLFVSRRHGHLYHEKYQFAEVYPTKDGRWATCGDPNKYESDVNRCTQIKAKKIEFAVSVTADDGRTPCSEGAYAEDVFEVKRRGVLKHRGLFGEPTKEPNQSPETTARAGQ